MDAVLTPLHNSHNGNAEQFRRRTHFDLQQTTSAADLTKLGDDTV